MATARNKRWNGDFDALPVEYLKGVMEKMTDYGDRVQFSLVSGGPAPSYQVINTLEKKMAFDRSHHLLRPQEEDFATGNATRIFTLDQVKAAISGLRVSSGRAARGVRVARTASASPRTSAAKLDDQFATQRYEYFRNNRQTLPPTIAEHSNEIVALMKTGKSVEEAFSSVVQKYFQ